MKPRNRQGASTLFFDAICRGCLLRIYARRDKAVEVTNDQGFHRGWAHVECAAILQPDDEQRAPSDEGGSQ